jgi:hypothetical protein
VGETLGKVGSGHRLPLKRRQRGIIRALPVSRNVFELLDSVHGYRASQLLLVGTPAFGAKPPLDVINLLYSVHA